MEDYVAIRTLKRHNPGIGSRKLSELFGVSRNTIRKALRSEKFQAYERPPRKNINIIPFKEYIDEQIIVKNLLGSRVLNDIISKGYKGSESAFYRYTSQIKRPVKRTFKPYETSPGEQAQFDWSPYTVVISGELIRIYIFCFILGYSRYRIYEVSLSQNGSSVYEAMEESIRQIGGTTQRVQTDNASCFVVRCSGRGAEWNTRYLNLCNHYSFEPSHSLPRHPWSKGKVESPFYYLENHFIKDNKFSDFNDLKTKLKQFQNEVNNRIHDTTQQTPVALFEKEKPSLMTLPDTRFVDIKEQVRKVTSDCLISFDGNRYSVPHQFACREVWIRVSRGCMLEVYSSKNLLIASHNISTQKKTVIIEDSHYLNHRIERGNWKRLSETFLHLFPSFEWFLDKLKTQKRINTSYHLTQIIDLAKFYSVDDVICSFNVCNSYNVFSCHFIKGILENNKVSSPDVKPLSDSLLILHDSKNIKRPLSEYSDLLNNYTVNLSKENII